MNTSENRPEKNDDDGPNWKWWHFFLAGILIAAWSVWRWWETGLLKHLGGLILALLCVVVGIGMTGKKSEG